MRLKPTKNTLVLLAAVLGLLTVALGGVLWLEWTATVQTNQVWQTKDAELRDGQKIARRREDARRSLDEDRQQIHFLENSVSDAAYVPTLLKQLEDLATSTHNRVLAVRPQVVADPGPTKMQQRKDPDAALKDTGSGDNKDAEKKVEKVDPYTRLGIQVTLVGGYQSTQLFIDRMMRFPKILSVDEIQLRPHLAQTRDATKP